MSKRKANEKQELQVSAKLAQIDILAQEYGIAPQNVVALKNKYGPYAYDIITLAQKEPKKLMKRINQDQQSFENIISYFAQNDLTTEQLAKAVNENELKVQSVLAQYQISKPESRTLPKEISLNELIRISQTSQQKIEQATEDKKTSSKPVYHEVKREDSQPTPPVSPQTPEPKTTEPAYSEVPTPTPAPAARNIQDMTLQDYITYCPTANKPAASYKDLETAAYKDFCVGEGVSQDLYLDCNGHVTIGCGHLVLHADHLKNPQELAHDKNAYINLPLKNSKGMPYTAEQKSIQFDKLVKAMRNKTLVTEQMPNAGKRIVGFKENGKVFAFGKLNDTSIRNIFNQDFRQFYDRVKIDKYNKNRKIFPEFDNFPLPVQLEILHTLYVGKITPLYDKTKHNNTDLASIHQAVVTLRNHSGASWGEKQTIQAAGQCIEKAQDNYINNKPQPNPAPAKSSTTSRPKYHAR